MAGRRLPELYYDPRALAEKPAKAASFHAKCIVVDRQCALVTSANPTKAAYERNIELGIMVEGGGLATTIENWFEHLIANRHLKRLPVVVAHPKPLHGLSADRLSADEIAPRGAPEVPGSTRLS